MPTLSETTPSVFNKIQDYLKNKDPEEKISINASAYDSMFFISFYWDRTYSPDVFNKDKYFKGLISDLENCFNKEIFPFIYNLVSELYESK